MKVVYESTILDEIKEEIEADKRLGVKIDHFILTTPEWEQLKELAIDRLQPCSAYVVTIYGIAIKVED